MRAEKSLEFIVLYGRKRYKTIITISFLEISPLRSPRFRSVLFGRNDKFFCRRAKRTKSASGHFRLCPGPRNDLLLTKVQGMETEMQGMKKKLDKLSLGQLEIRKEIIMLNRKISDTYDVALDALGTSAENREWLEKGTLA